MGDQPKIRDVTHPNSLFFRTKKYNSLSFLIEFFVLWCLKVVEKLAFAYILFPHRCSFKSLFKQNLI